MSDVSDERLAVLERNHATLEVTLNKILEVLNHAADSQRQEDTKGDEKDLQPIQRVLQGESGGGLLRYDQRGEADWSGRKNQTQEETEEIKQLDEQEQNQKVNRLLAPPEERISFGDVGYVWIDDNQQTWWVPYGKTPELLVDCDSVCGCSFFNTGYRDKLKPACDWHDRMYRARAWSEQHGWDRAKIDSYFKELLMNLAMGNSSLVAKVKLFYMFVRAVGGLFYYRHPGYEVTK